MDNARHGSESGRKIRPLKESEMASQPSSNHEPKLAPPYCSDPNCESCKELREELAGLKPRLNHETDKGDAA